MITQLSHVTIWAKNQEEAKKFYVEVLGFKVRTDDRTTIPNYRWLTVMPPKQGDVEIVLGLATEPGQIAQVGKQGTWVLVSDNIQQDYQRLKEKGVKVYSEPQEDPWGTDFVFEDLCGNTFDLVQSPKG